jgi:hypothetical protein
MPLLALNLLFGSEVAAQEAVRLCREVGTDDTLRAIPSSLVPAAKRLFGLRMELAQVQRATVFRCAEGRVLLCTYGANLPCGKANTERHLPGADAWCRDHPDSDMIPTFATGSDTIYRWRCAGGASEIVGQAADTDARGFVARYWKPLN